MKRLAFVVAFAWSVVAGAQQIANPFPHATHAKLFPTCEGCHAGIATGDSATMYPAPTLCANCHDGQIVKRIRWNGPTPRPSNLAFSHVSHAQASARAGGPAVPCAACHAPEDSGRVWMAVGVARPADCLSCHAHAATAHLARDNVCTTCHVRLTEAHALTKDAIAAFPRPPSHDQPDFLSHHAPETAADEAQCATCHTRESCEQCHVNASQLRAVTQLGTDPRVAALVAGRPGAYPIPKDHQSALWATEHAQAAMRAGASCANCHTQSSCIACHIGPDGGGAVASAIAALPQDEAGKAQGVVIHHAPTGVPPVPQPGVNSAPAQGTTFAPPVMASARATVTRLPGSPPPAAGVDSGRRYLVQVHWPGFMTSHAAVAATQQLACATCHVQRFCTDCHLGEQKRDFHPANFMARHATEAYNRQLDCTSCHNPEAFCRTCHFNVGVGTRNPRNAAFHNAQPLWLLQHGQAARQSLESCTTCHQQADCMRCHSTLGWGVNPHGPGFNAQAMASRNPQVCLECHLSNPLTGPGR